MNFTSFDIKVENRRGRRAELNMPRLFNCRKMTKARIANGHYCYLCHTGGIQVK